MTEHPKYQIIAGIAGTFTILSVSNLIHRVYHTQNTEHLTYTWIFLILAAQSLLVLYGILNKAYGIYIPALLVISGISYILFVKLSNIKENKIEMELINKNIL
jgi:uncharacterized protein with PQ loop repeat